ncbi:MAG: hypothetical protein F4087_07790 [Gemmatimonadetes bacterium]|nr:hypothetical protein [Gemmatimonadota bacterium]MYE70868.1 hypothetical protein [Gemmatimonadota bacterium]MYJ68389.1 hypothetical protein [Gemmatimonadota bacterium]
MRDALAAAALIGLLACGESEGAPHDTVQTVWITEAQHQFGDAPEQDVFFIVPYVRSDLTGDGVLVLDGGTATVSAWSPDGVLRFTVGGQGQGPGEFVSAQDLFVESNGSFWVKEGIGSRFTHYGADGTLLGTARGVDAALGYQGFGVILAWPHDGGYLGFPEVYAGAEAGRVGLPPVDRQPLLRVRRSDSGQWEQPEPLLWMDVSNRMHVMELADGSPLYGRQWFGDADRVVFEPDAAVLMRVKGEPGTVELLETSVAGDTVWHRHLRLEPRKLTARMIEEEVDERVAALAPDLTAPEDPMRVSRGQLREMYTEALYTPEYLPAAERHVLASSGEVWIKTTERSDTLRAYYAVRRDGVDEPPRRVLLPESLMVHDATDTHVWGIWRDSMDRPHVVGRRLVRKDE